MRVRVGDKTYDTCETPIALFMTERERRSIAHQIGSMTPVDTESGEIRVYAMLPTSMRVRQEDSNGAVWWRVVQAEAETYEKSGYGK